MLCRSVMWVICALALFATQGCASSSSFVFTPSSRLIPVINSPEPGSAVGRCVAFGEDGPATAPCPMSVDSLLDRVQKPKSTGRGSYAYGAFVQGDELSSPPGQSPQWRPAPRATIYEMATYSTQERPLKRKFDDVSRQSARSICKDTSLQRVPVIVREFEGCSVTLTGKKREAEDWTVDHLARSGTKVGQPSGFWSQQPDLDMPSENAKCKSKRVVRVEVLPLRAICHALFQPEELGHSSVALP